MVLVQVAFSTSTALPSGGNLPCAPGVRFAASPQATSYDFS